MPEFLVIGLEMVDVGKEQRDRFSVPTGARHFFTQPLLKGAVVIEAGQGVLEGEALELVLRLRQRCLEGRGLIARLRGMAVSTVRPLRAWRAISCHVPPTLQYHEKESPDEGEDRLVGGGCVPLGPGIWSSFRQLRGLFLVLADHSSHLGLIRDALVER